MTYLYELSHPQLLRCTRAYLMLFALPGAGMGFALLFELTDCFVDTSIGTRYFRGLIHCTLPLSFGTVILAVLMLPSLSFNNSSTLQTFQKDHLFWSFFKITISPIDIDGALVICFDLNASISPCRYSPFQRLLKSHNSLK